MRVKTRQSAEMRRILHEMRWLSAERRIISALRNTAVNLPEQKYPEQRELKIRRGGVFGAQKYGGKYTGNPKFGTQKRGKNTAWKPDKSFSHNPVGKRFGQTDTPPETKPEKAVENEPKQ